jgi:hypothetical protein
MTTPDEILEHGIEEVTKILGRSVAEQIFNQILRKKAALPTKENSTSLPRQSTLNYFGG